MKFLKNSILGLFIFSNAACAGVPKQAVQPTPATISLQELTPNVVPGPVLYVFAHQDDELLALHKLHLDIKSGKNVHAVWITDGGKSANPARREKESRTVMGIIGVKPQNLHFFGFPDQSSNRWLKQAYERLVLLNRSHAFTEIVSPTYEGGNIDHDVAAFLSAQLTAASPAHPVHVEYPLYNRYKGKRQIGSFLPGREAPAYYLKVEDDTRELAKKAMKEYRSQRMGLFLMEFVTDKQAIINRGVQYRIAPPFDFLKRPTDEVCDYEKSLFHPAKFADWQASVREFGEVYGGEGGR